MTRDGCGETKGCLFKPAGCDPMRDCTQSIIFYVSGPNMLMIQLSATSLVPPPPLQYMAVAFSKDLAMGDDYVAECVMSPNANEEFASTEVFLSYNIGKSNDRTSLNSTENQVMIRDVQGEVLDSRLHCQFSLTIIPQMPTKGGRLWNLNHKFYVFGATGSSEADHINVHDLNMDSHFYPLVSGRRINPSVIGEQLYELPKPYKSPPPPPIPLTTTTQTPTVITVTHNNSADRLPYFYVNLYITILIILLSKARL
uniref:DOMON domain-containing protein n=1 Tax=Acrobeloides nanus TaxID=290746 RepID=A0A914CM06_9BILA